MTAPELFLTKTNIHPDYFLLLVLNVLGLYEENEFSTQVDNSVTFIRDKDFVYGVINVSKNLMEIVKYEISHGLPVDKWK